MIRDRLFAPVDLGDGQALDIVAAPGKQPDDARQHARLVVDEHGDRMAFRMSDISTISVIPAKAGIQGTARRWPWSPLSRG